MSHLLPREVDLWESLKHPPFIYSSDYTHHVLHHLQSDSIDWFHWVLEHLRIEFRHFGHPRIESLSFFFLQLDAYTTNRSLLDTLHEMSDVSVQYVNIPLFHSPGHSITQFRACHFGHFITDTLVHVKVLRHASVVLLDDHTGCLLHCLGTNTRHRIGLKNI